MVGLRDILNRFRPVATPGAPGPRGVPADRSMERESELVALFAALAGTQRQAEEIRRRARVEADQVRRDARQRADALVAEAGVRAEASRSGAAANVRASVERERARARQGAVNMTEQRASRAAEQVPGLVARVVALARTELDELGTTRAVAS